LCFCFIIINQVLIDTYEFWETSFRSLQENHRIQEVSKIQPKEREYVLLCLTHLLQLQSFRANFVQRMMNENNNNIKLKVLNSFNKSVQLIGG